MADGESSYRRFLEGDESGFEEVVDIYKDNLIYFINRFVHNLDIAEDIAADTFADLFVHKNRYNLQPGLYYSMLDLKHEIDADQYAGLNN